MRRREREHEYLHQMDNGRHMDMEGEGGEVEDNEYQHDDGHQQDSYNPLRYKQHQMQ